jgi:hypothetical protein
MTNILVGKTDDRIKIALPNSLRTGHVQIIGSTGRGKTESVIIPWMVQDLIHERTTVLIDGKGDQKIYELLKTVNEENDAVRPVAYFDIGNIDDSMTTNPLKYGSPQQIADRLFASLEFDNIYFKNVSYSAALMVARLVSSQKEENNRELTFRKLVGALTDDGYLADLFSGSSEDLRPVMAKYLSQKYFDRQETLSGLIAQIEPFASGELSEILNGDVSGRESFSLPEIIYPEITENNRFTPKTAVILIPTLLYQKSAAILGKMFLQEIAWGIAMKERARTNLFASIFLDEFSAFVYPGFLGILNKARSTNTAFHISHQSLGDLSEISEGFAQAIHTNTNIKCVFGLNDPVTADFFAKHFGTRDIVEATERASENLFGEVERSGALNVRNSECYKIHPNRLKNLSQGRGVLSFIHNGHQILEEVQFLRSPYQERRT